MTPLHERLKKLGEEIIAEGNGGMNLERHGELLLIWSSEAWAHQETIEAQRKQIEVLKEIVQRLEKQRL